MTHCRTLLFAIICLIASNNAYSQVKISLLAGGSKTNIRSYSPAMEEDDFEGEKAYFKSGYNIGILFRTEVFNNNNQLKGCTFGGVNFENKGFIYDAYANTGNYWRPKWELVGQEAFDVTYLSIPAFFQLKYTANSTFSFVNLGFYFSHALHGNIKALGDYKDELKAQDLDYSSAISLGYDSSSDTLKPIDSGCIFGAGLGYKDISVSLNCQLGLLNLLPEDADDKVKNFSLSLWFIYDLHS